MSQFIGVVDLTVRLSSMNPLGHIEIQDASRRFERAIIQTCKTMRDMALREKDKDLLRFYDESGIVTYGGSEKYFHFPRYEQIIVFSRTLRSRLISDRLPFKICIARGVLGDENIRSQIQPLLEKLASADQIERGASQNALIKRFNTCDPQEIDAILRIYRAPSSSHSSVNLYSAWEDFKGFGIWIDAGIMPDNADQISVNYFPVKMSNKRLDLKSFFDFPFVKDKNDVIRITHGGEGPETEPGVPADSREIDVRMESRQGSSPMRKALASGHATMIEAVFDLLRRFYKAGEDNTIYYVSILSTIVRSSYFGELTLLKKAELIDGASSQKLAAGWQCYPPIFYALLMDHGYRSMVRKIPGIELVLAALIDELHAALTGEPSSALIKSVSKGGVHDGSLISQDIGTNVFGDVIRYIESIFGEGMIRRIWSVPHDIMSEDRKRAMLEVMTRR